MKKISAIMIILIFLVSIIAVPALADDDYEEFGPEFQEKVKKIEKAAQKLEKLAKKFENTELDIIKTEDMIVSDQDGNGVACTFEIYYDSDEVVQFTTEDDGTYTGNFNHGKNYPGKVISFKMSQCQCKVKKIKHQVSFPGYDEVVERMKVLIQDELKEKGKEQAKKVGKKMVEKGFSAAGAAKLAGPFLWGVEKGAELGQPFGEMLSKGLNDVLDATRKKNRQYRELLEEIEPATGKRITARWWDLFRTEPMLKNIWDIDVVCDENYGEYNMDYFQDPKDYMPKPPKPKKTSVPSNGIRSAEEKKAQEEYEREYERERKKREREEKERIRKEQERIKKEREEARKRLEAAIKKVKKECPPCDPIRKLIEETEDAIDKASGEIPELESKVKQKEKELADKKDKRDRNQQLVDNFNNPQSSASSEGRTVTSSDLAIDRMVAKSAWKEYIDGKISADQLESKWKNYDDEAREKAKKDYKKEIEDELAKAKEAATQAQIDLSTAKSTLSTKQQHLENLKKSLPQLEKELEDCLKLCDKYARHIAQGQITTFEDMVAREGKKTLPKVSGPTVPVTPKEEPKSTGPCREGEFLNDARCSNSCKPHEECEWYRTVDEGTCTGCTAKCEVGESLSENVCMDDCDGECTRNFRTDCWVCGESVGSTGSKTCDEYCKTMGSYVGVDPGWKDYIMDEVSGEECRESVSISYPGLLDLGECTCYGDGMPSISYGPVSFCEDTSCGDVPCGSSATCSCGSNCEVTVNCNWGGWEWVGDAISGGVRPLLNAESE